MYADAFREIEQRKYQPKPEPSAYSDAASNKNFASQPSQSAYSSTGSNGPITCEKLMLISKAMTRRAFTKLDDYFLGPAV
jgi:hypothetical protein